MDESILFLGPASGTSLHRIDAFKRLGYRVRNIDPRGLLPRSPWVDRFEWHVSPDILGKVVARRLERLLAGERFDLAFVDSGSLVTRDAVRALHRHCERVVNFNHDDPYGRRDWVRFSAYRRAVREYDLVVVVRKPNVEEAERLGARKVLLHARVADEVAHRPRPLTAEIEAAWASDVAFVGSWMPERGPFMLDLVRRGVPLALFGPGWNKAPEWSDLRPYLRAEYLDGDSYAYAVQCAKISLGMLSKGNRDLHTTRSMEIPALGGLLCAERTDEHEGFYEDGREALFWTDSADCATICASLLADESRRKTIATNGHRRYLRNGYTSENLIRDVMNAVSEPLRPRSAASGLALCL